MANSSVERYHQQDWNFFKHDTGKVVAELGKEKLLEYLYQMLLIRNFEIRAESAYQHGHIGGFFHSYMGQEAIQTGAVAAIGVNNWWITTYRCHALALLLGVSVNEMMAELYGKATGNAMGRGGSMHLYTDRLMGGFGIVGGHVPIATGAAFALKYQEIKNEVSVCFMGDGAVVQGAFHEALNLASLWDLPCIYVVENNLWGMGTAVERAVCNERIAEEKAPSYRMESFTFNGTDFFNCYAGFQHVAKLVKESERPVLIEAVAERFKGHSVSDPGLYRSKDDLKEAMKRDPLLLMKQVLMESGFIDEEGYKQMDKEAKELVVASMKYAEESPWPDPTTLEEDVLAP